MTSFITGGLLLLTLATTTAETRLAQPAEELVRDPHFAIERVQWLGETREGGWLEVHNGFGDLRLRFGGYEAQVEVLATLQQFPDEGAPLEVVATESEEGVTVRVGYRRDERGDLVTDRDPAGRRRVDLVVFIPEAVSVRASTEQGLLEIKGVHGDIDARTVSGKMVVRSVAGTLDLSTESGSILVSFDSHEPQRGHSLSSTTGDLTAIFWEDASFTVGLGTRGRISTDYSMKIEHAGTEARLKHGVAVVGKGRAELKLESENGHIRLVRRPLARQAKNKETN